MPGNVEFVEAAYSVDEDVATRTPGGVLTVTVRRINGIVGP